MEEWIWEKLGASDPTEKDCGHSFRMKVPGGWLVRSDIQICDPYGKGRLKITSVQTFVADAQQAAAKEGK
jgi:dissimilatory sulfite reductase (desulfoviridin) alpha/beta subunit